MVVSETVSYAALDGLPVASYLARPDAGGKFPAVLMCYEFWGMLEVPGGGPHMRSVAQRFAAAGYVALVPDYYATRGQQPTMEGGTIVGSPPDEEADRDLIAGIDWLRAQPFVDADRVVTIGWCGGGRHALFLAARCPGLRAAASFYGRPVNRAVSEQQPVSPIDLVGEMRCPVFGAYGEDDQAIPVASVRQLEAALVSKGVIHEVHVYAGAGHAFMNDERDSYVPEAAVESWTAVLAFFERAMATPE